jgi:hypothetical protein
MTDFERSLRRCVAGEPAGAGYERRLRALWRRRNDLTCDEFLRLLGIVRQIRRDAEIAALPTLPL